jgi:hypothetical protein
MDNKTDTFRTMAEALADLYNKVDRATERSVCTRLDLERMIQGLEAEITDRAARVLALH